MAVEKDARQEGGKANAAQERICMHAEAYRKVKNEFCCLTRT